MYILHLPVHLHVFASGFDVRKAAYRWPAVRSFSCSRSISELAAATGRMGLVGVGAFGLGIHMIDFTPESTDGPGRAYAGSLCVDGGIGKSCHAGIFVAEVLSICSTISVRAPD